MYSVSFVSQIPPARFTTYLNMDDSPDWWLPDARPDFEMEDVLWACPPLQRCEVGIETSTSKFEYLSLSTNIPSSTPVTVRPYF